MATEIRIFSNIGEPLADLDATARWSSEINAMGKAQITIAKTDAHATEDILRFGNHVLIEHDQAGRWGGEIWTPRPWGKDAITFQAYGKELALKYRYSDTASFTDTAGGTFSSLVDEGNAAEDMLIDLGAVYDAGLSWTEVPSDNDFYTIMKKLAKFSGQEWSIEPALRGNGRLYFVARWHAARGAVQDFVLEEGTHFKEDGGNLLIEQGDIYNDIRLTAFNGSTTTTVYAEDSASIAKYGRRQKAFRETIPSDYTASDYADLLLAKYKEPRRTFPLRVINHSDWLSYCGTGDTVSISLVRTGFTDNEPGLETSVRILGREFREEDGFMTLTVDEVVS